MGERSIYGAYTDVILTLYAVALIEFVVFYILPFANNTLWHSSIVWASIATLTWIYRKQKELA